MKMNYMHACVDQITIYKIYKQMIMFKTDKYYSVETILVSQIKK